MSERPVGFGCMRVGGADVVRAALDSGATLLDTAGAYGHEADAHANERHVTAALAGRDRDAITVVTKGGLVRDGTRYVPDGRIAGLRAQCEESVAALGFAPDLYLLHAVDPRVPLETSVRALAALRDEGLVRRIGLSNVTVTQLERAAQLADIDCVEVALSPYDAGAVRGGVLERCAVRGTLLLAHTPLGGPTRAVSLAKDAVLAAVARKHAVDPAAVVVAWLRSLSPVVVPIPGTRSAAHAVSLVRAASLVLDADDLAAIDARFDAVARARGPRVSRPPDDADGDVVLVMGVQGSGKTTYARTLVAQGYTRLNRDDEGGTLRALHKRLDAALASGARRVVLDNTYATRAVRADAIEAAWKHGVPVRCIWLDVPMPVAQANAVWRIVEKAGRLLAPGEMEKAAKKDASIVPPRALFRFRRELEPPALDEGFRSIDVLGFERRVPPGDGRPRLLVALDAVARFVPPYDAFPLAVDTRTLDALRRRDASLSVIAWTPVEGDAERAALDAALPALRDALGGAALYTCPHPGGPPICWCRPPLPGLAVAWAHAEHVDLSRAIVLGTGAHHRTVADALALRYEQLPIARAR